MAQQISGSLSYAGLFKVIKRKDSGYEIISLMITKSQLYFLCLVLLELAVSSPLRNLQLPESIAKDLTILEREYLTVTRLVETF